MLSFFRKNHISLLNKSISKFGGSHGGPVEVKLDQNAKWISYKANRKLACVEGINDVHIPAPSLIREYPFSHTKNARFFSDVLFYYNDPFHHDNEFEKHTVGEQGYLISDDPNDTRYDLVYPSILTSMIALGIFIALEYSNIYAGTSIEQIIQQGLNAETLVDRVLSEKASIIQSLEKQIQQLRESKK